MFRARFDSHPKLGNRSAAVELARMIGALRQSSQDRFAIFKLQLIRRGKTWLLA